jgi:glutathione S-transferase
MSKLTLYIGNKNYSSWSLRGWLAVKLTGQPFDEVLIPLDRPETRASILAHSPSGRVPALKHGPIGVWDSFSIGEYLAETFPDARLWPVDAAARASARSIAAEMHAGFGALREAMPMNIRARQARTPSDAVAADIDRITALWREARGRSGGPFLFGRVSLADVAFAPVVTRFQTYEVKVDEASQSYMKTILDWPHMQEWISAAKAEPFSIPHYDV